MKFFFDLDPGVMLPWWAGVVRHRIEYQSTQCCPIVLNLVIRLTWYWWEWMKRPFRVLDSAMLANYWKDRAYQEMGRANQIERDLSFQLELCRMDRDGHKAELENGKA